MAGSMEDGYYYYDFFRFDNFVNNAIRKSLRIEPTDIFGWVTARIKKRILPESVPNVKYLLKEF